MGASKRGLKRSSIEFSALQNICCLYLATGQADHDLVAVFNHVEIGNRLTGQSAKALLQFVLVDRESAHDAKSVRCDERRAFYAKKRPVGAAEGCDLLILIFDGAEIIKDQKIAAFGSSYRRNRD